MLEVDRGRGALARLPTPSVGARGPPRLGQVNRRRSACRPQPFRPILPGMVVSEADAAAIRIAYAEGGELSAAIELRRLFPGIIDNENARRCARSIAGWQPVPVQPVKRPASRRRAPRSA
jgi:hypothetical protein